MLDKVKALLAALPKEDQAELKRYLSDILVTEDEAEAIHLASLQARTPAGKTVTYTYRQERVRCGKGGCWCAEGAGHGPYTYRYWKENGRLRKQYVKRPDAAARGARARGSSAASRTDPASPA
jgi:hypothetical protein